MSDNPMLREERNKLRQKIISHLEVDIDFLEEILQISMTHLTRYTMNQRKAMHAKEENIIVQLLASTPLETKNVFTILRAVKLLYADDYERTTALACSRARDWLCVNYLPIRCDADWENRNDVNMDALAAWWEANRKEGNK